jgi:hypothetical protein
MQSFEKFYYQNYNLKYQYKQINYLKIIFILLQLPQISVQILVYHDFKVVFKSRK